MTPLAILKILVLIACAASHYIGLRAPNSPPTKDDVVYKGQLFEKVVRIMCHVSQATTIAFIALQCTIIIISQDYQGQDASQLIRALCPVQAPEDVVLPLRVTSFNQAFCIGAVLMIAGATLRVWCFKALGWLFTFEVTVRPQHKLKTSGPYSFVRHPSYTAVLLMLIGAAMVCYGDGSYAKSCKIKNTFVGGWIYIWYTSAIFAIFSLIKRGAVEDENLRQAFGEEWAIYRAHVPHSFIPGIL